MIDSLSFGRVDVVDLGALLAVPDRTAAGELLLLVKVLLNYK